MIKKHTWRMQTKIFAAMMVFIVVIFSIEELFFISFINGYIRNSVEAQLDSLVKKSNTHIYKFGDRNIGFNAEIVIRNPGDGTTPSAIISSGAITSPDYDETNLPDLSDQPASEVGTKGHVFVVDKNLNIKNQNFTESDTISNIIKYLQNQNIEAGELRNVDISTGTGEYYLSMTEDAFRNGDYMVFYVDVTSIMNFARTINIALIMILLIGTLLSFLIANVIARYFTSYVTKLSDFAAEIGKGQFKRQEFDFKDSEFVKLAESMNKTAEMLDETSKKQDAFFQNVSHELRTPLMSIRCYAEGIECGVMDAKQSSQTILSETDRLSDMVEDLLYMSRMNSEPDVETMEEHDLRESFSGCVSDQRAMAEKLGLNFEFDFDEDPVIFKYHETDFHKIFSNLLSNAMRYAKKTIFLTCHIVDDNIEITVTDDGDGISSEDLPHIFERFYKGKGGKNGIGLSIVSSAVEMYGGNIQAECNGHTSFIIMLPLKKAGKKKS